MSDVRNALIREFALDGESDALLEARAARAHGIPLSQFRQWDKADREVALALQEFEDTSCDGCGVPSSIAEDPGLQSEWRSGLPIRCHSCTAAEKMRVSYTAQYAPEDAPQALKFVARLRGGVRA